MCGQPPSASSETKRALRETLPHPWGNLLRFAARLLPPEPPASTAAESPPRCSTTCRTPYPVRARISPGMRTPHPYCSRIAFFCESPVNATTGIPAVAESFFRAFQDIRPGQPWQQHVQQKHVRLFILSQFYRLRSIARRDYHMPRPRQCPLRGHAQELTVVDKKNLGHAIPPHVMFLTRVRTFLLSAELRSRLAQQDR